MAAARVSLFEILVPEAYGRLERLGAAMAAGCGMPSVTSLGGKGSLGLGGDPELSELVWTYLMNRGVYTTPGRGPEWNLTVAHTDAEVKRYLAALGELVAELR